MKLTRDRLKQIIKEELEEMVDEQPVVQEQNFQAYLAAVKGAQQKSPLSEADMDPKSPEVQSKIQKVKSFLGTTGLNAVKGALGMGLDMATILAIVGMTKGISPQEVADMIPVLGFALGSGAMMGSTAGALGVKPTSMSAVGNVAGKIKDTFRGK